MGSQDDISRTVTNATRFLEVCVNTGRNTIKLAEIDTSTVTDDGELFRQINKEYYKLRGTGLKRMFMRPVGVHYVLVC